MAAATQKARDSCSSQAVSRDLDGFYGRPDHGGPVARPVKSGEKSPRWGRLSRKWVWQSRRETNAGVVRRGALVCEAGEAGEAGARGFVTREW
jgi:hypothetical protein